MLTNSLVTGGSGMIGRKVVELLSHPFYVDKPNKLLPELDAIFIPGDLADFNFCKQVTRNMDYVFHVAGVKGSPKMTKERPADFFVPMLQMNTNILEACRLNNVKGVVYVSSIGAGSNEQGEPLDYFPGWAKRMGELQIRAYKEQYGLENFSIVRPSNVYGEGDRFDETSMVIPSLMMKIARGDDPVIIWGDGSEIRDFVYSGDVAQGIIQAMIYGTRGHFVNLGCGGGYSIWQLVETLKSFIDFNYKFEPSKARGHPKRVLDIWLAQQTICYNPTTTLEEGLKKTWKSYQQSLKMSG